MQDTGQILQSKQGSWQKGEKKSKANEVNLEGQKK